MKLNKINIFWFKRDIRLIDNLPLYHATKNKIPTLLVYFLEEELIKDPHYSDIHWNFVKESIKDIDISLGKKSVLFIKSDPIEAIKKIREKYDINSVFSHQETGINLTYKRDIEFNHFCKIYSINWYQFEKNYVKRGIRNRQNWIKGWNEYVKGPLVNLDLKNLVILDPNNFKDDFNIISTKTFPNKNIQPGGTSKGIKYLESFLNKRIKNYTKNISKPEESRSSCSRLSPYISWGNLSSRYVWQKAKKTKKNSNSLFQINSFLSRLRWNAHFIQKFEMESSIEFKSINRGYLSLNKIKNKKFIDLWEQGKTGYPLVDASILCLKETGYLNFRMRSMIVSFFTHHLWQPWQDASHFLARNFLDFEPGIHYNQLQMQAGETGINTIRIYNPTKNAIEKDNNAIFIKKWIPNLKGVPIPLIFEPWKLSIIEQKLYSCKIGKDYPYPIVDISLTRKYALDNLWNMRKSKKVNEEKYRILKKHVNS